MEEMHKKKITNKYAFVSLILAVLYFLYLFLMVTPCNNEGIIIANPEEGTLKIINFIMWVLFLATMITSLFSLYFGLKKYQRKGVNLSILILAIFIIIHAYLMFFQCS